MGVMGFEVAICTIIGYWIGSFAGNRLGHSEAWVAGGVIGGLAVGIVSVVLLLKKVLGETNE